MDIALESFNNAQRQRYTGPPPQRNPQMVPNPRGQTNFNPNQNFEGNQYQQGGRPVNPRYAQQDNNQNSNYRGQPQQQNFRDNSQQQQSHQQFNSNPNQNYQQEYSQLPRQNRFPPPPQRDFHSQPHQNQFEERPQPGYRNQNMPNHYQQQQNFDQDHEQLRFNKRQPYNREEGNNFREEDGGKNYRQNVNPKFRGHQQVNQRIYNQQNQRPPQQYDRNVPNRNQQRKPYGMHNQEQTFYQRGRGRGRGLDRGRGRGRGRGRQISRAIQQSEYHNLPPVNKKPVQQKKPQPQQESGSAQGSQMSQQEYNSRSGTNESQEQAVQQSEVQEQSRSNDESAEQESASENENEEQRSEEQSARQAPGRVPARAESESSASLNMQQIHTMCSKDQYEERLETFITNNRNLQGNMMRLDTGRSFAIFEINKKTGEPDYALTLKRYRRSTNRSQDDDENDEETDLPRSRAGLMMAIRHIHKQIIDADNVKQRQLAFPFPPGENTIQFLHIFDFLWNRMREMIKDVSRLDMRDRSSQQIITMCEQMVRFFIIAIRQGKLAHNCRLQFDPKLNLQSITKILTQLLEIYQQLHMKLHKKGSASIFISPNQPEIIGYAIIISNDIHNTLNEKLMIRLNGEGLNHPLLASKEIQNALKIKKALRNRNFQTFYHILEDQHTDYVLTCLLMHHLPIVRRETLRFFQKVTINDPVTKTKKLPQDVFRQALRFKSKQSHEFKEFLSEARATVINENGQSFILLGQFEDNIAENHIAASYLFDNNKLLRSRYNLKNSSKRLLNPSLMSRQQLTKRSWFKGKYSRLAKRYYNPSAEEEQQQSEEEEREEKEAPVQKQTKKQIQLITQPQKIAPSSPVPQADGNKLNLLLLKRKQLQRNKFLKNLQNLIQNLIKNSDIHSQHKRKKGLQTILELTDLSRILVLDSAFIRLSQYVYSRKVAQEKLRELQKYSKIKQQFESIYNRSTFQFNKPGRGQFVKMSELLKHPKKPKEQSILKRLFQVYLESQPTGRRRLRTLYIFLTDPKRSLSELQKAFLANFYVYISLDNKKSQTQAQSKINQLLDVNYDNYLQFEKSMILTSQTGLMSLDYSFTLLNYRANSNCEHPFLSGYDGVVFLDLWKNVNAFSNLIKEFQQGRRKIFNNENRKLPTSTQNYLAFHVGSTEGIWQSGNLIEYESKKEGQWQSSWLRLQSESIKISSSLKITMMSFLSAQLRQPQQKTPDLAVYSLSSLIDQVQRNLECLSGEDLNQGINAMQFLQLYFNESLECLRKAVLYTAVSYEIFDWKQILLEAIYSKPGNYLTFQTPPETIFNEQRLNLNQQLSKKFIFSLELISTLKLSLTQNYAISMKQGKGENGLYVLSQLAENYLQGLSKEDIEDYFSCLVAYVIQNNCNLLMTETLSGDCKNLFIFILSKVKQKLKYCNIILPKCFQFRIPKSSLIKQQKKIEKTAPQSPFKKAEENKRQFVYGRSELLKRLLQEIKQPNQQRQRQRSKSSSSSKLDCQANQQQDRDDKVMEVSSFGKKVIKMR